MNEGDAREVMELVFAACNDDDEIYAPELLRILGQVFGGDVARQCLIFQEKIKQRTANAQVRVQMERFARKRRAKMEQKHKRRKEPKEPDIDTRLRSAYEEATSKWQMDQKFKEPLTLDSRGG